MYLIRGDKKCLLIDTGWGIGDLPNLIASLSPLPLTVMNSHGHPDHAYGNSMFKKVYVHEADISFINKPPDSETRKWITKNILPKPSPENFNIDVWASKVPSLIPIEEGHVFNLGNRHLETICVPGHTPGSVCVLDCENRLLFTGDTIQNPTWLHLEESLPLGQFHKNLKQLQSRMNEFDYILPGHADLQTLPWSKTLVNELVSGIERILEGALVGREEKTFAGDGLRCDFGSSGIVYRSDRL
jgi:hydroxyacylglutathione hydrolase